MKFCGKILSLKKGIQSLQQMFKKLIKKLHIKLEYDFLTSLRSATSLSYVYNLGTVHIHVVGFFGISIYADSNSCLHSFELSPL